VIVILIVSRDLAVRDAASQSTARAWRARRSIMAATALRTAHVKALFTQ